MSCGSRAAQVRPVVGQIGAKVFARHRAAGCALNLGAAFSGDRSDAVDPLRDHRLMHIKQFRKFFLRDLARLKVSFQVHA